MKKTILVFVLVIVCLSFLMTGCSPKPVVKSETQVSISKLTWDSKYAGTADFEMYTNYPYEQTHGDGPYYWTAFEVWYPDSDCVYLGVNTFSADLRSAEGYKWVETETNNYCLQKDK